eukprot:5851961-Pleurochrysis_carterae.AAC.5
MRRLSQSYYSLLETPHSSLSQASCMVAVGGASAAAVSETSATARLEVGARTSAHRLPPQVRVLHEELRLLQNAVSATSAGDRAIHVPNLLMGIVLIAFATPPLLSKNSYFLAFVSILYSAGIRKTVLLYSRKAYLDEHVVQHAHRWLSEKHCEAAAVSDFQECMPHTKPKYLAALLRTSSI